MKSPTALALGKKAESARKRATKVNSQAKELETQCAVAEAAERGLELGMVVQGYQWIGVKKPRWITGTIKYIGCSWRSDRGKRMETAPCVTLEFANGKKAGFYMDSVRHLEVK